MTQSMARNNLLQTMLAGDYALLAPYLSRIALPVRFQLHAAHRTISKVYFPEDGIISIVAISLDGKPCEVGLFGREGMSETATVLGTDHSPHEAFVQAAGVSSLMLDTAKLDAAMQHSPTLRLHLLKYVQAMLVQLSSSIAAASQTTEQRLARWLLMCHDRVSGDTIRLTHEFVGMMLGVRRAGVTDAMITLGIEHLIVGKRGEIIIKDRAGLEALAAGSYGLAEAEYERLIGIPLRRGDAPAGRSPVPHPELA